MTIKLEIQNKNKKDFSRLVNRIGKQLAPTQYPEYKKCIRKNCLQEYKEYEEQLPTQLEKIAKCMFTENREKCFDQYYLPIINPLINCSKKECSQQMKKLVNKLKGKSVSLLKTQKKNKLQPIKNYEKLKEQTKINKNKKSYSESKAEKPQDTESKFDSSIPEISYEISYQNQPKESKESKESKPQKKNKKEDRMDVIFGKQTKYYNDVSLGRLDAQISDSTIGMHVESIKESRK